MGGEKLSFKIKGGPSSNRLVARIALKVNKIKELISSNDGLVPTKIASSVLPLIFENINSFIYTALPRECHASLAGAVYIMTRCWDRK